MNVIDSLERRFGRFAIPGLIRIIAAFNALVFILGKLNPALLGFLDLTREGIARHEYWRLVTYIFIPQTTSYLFIFFALSWLWMLGEGLERAWGAFKVNLFYLVGMIGTTLAALFFGSEFSNTMLNLSLLFAFARYYPDQMLLFPPIPIRWMAWILFALLLVNFATSSMAYQMALLAAMANYALFLGPEIVAQARQRREVTVRRRRFEESSVPDDEPLHRCTVCKRSEIGNPDLEFRVSRDGNEYCMEHLPSRTTTPS